jgi:outer membrane protein assembly factor BamE (lipoprotein component of BamABCDE complex)
MTTRRALALAAVVAGLCTSGCSTVGNGRMAQLDAVQANWLLVPGRTTRDEVRQALGQGTVLRFRSGRETWHYLYREGIAPGWDDVPYIGLITSRLQRPTKELVILFDGDGVLRRWSMQEYRTAPSKGA